MTDLLLSPTEAARLVGITADALKRYDLELAPMRTTTGRRIYLQSTIDAFVAHRAAARAAKAEVAA